jgi:hypothetical protein
MNAGLKAGLIGGAIVAVLQFAGLIPCVDCFTWLLALVVYVGAGVLAAYWLPAPRDAGGGAGAGAVAGVVSAIIGGIFGMIASGIQFVLTDTAAILAQMPEESLRALRDAGMDPQVFTSLEFTLAASGVCCVVVIFIAAVLGALGGGVFAAMQNE